MLRLGCAVLVMATSFAAAAPSGKVVRIERVRANKQASPIICEVKADLSGECIGGKPLEGDVIAVVDAQRVVAEVRVLSTAPANPKCDAMWRIKTAKLSGDLTTGHHQQNIGVVDAELEARGRHVKDETLNRSQVPNAAANSKAALGIDRNADGTSDIVVTWAQCGTGASVCLEIWSRRERTMVRTWTADFSSCF
jgi:hypothetical protein